MCCRFLKEKHDALAAQRAAEEGSLQPQQGSDESGAERADTHPHPSWKPADSLGDDSDDSSSEDDDVSRQVDTSSDDESDDESGDVSGDVSSRRRSKHQSSPPPSAQLPIPQQLSGAKHLFRAAMAVIFSDSVRSSDKQVKNAYKNFVGA